MARLNKQDLVINGNQYFKYLYKVEAIYFSGKRSLYYTKLDDVKRYVNKYVGKNDNLYLVNIHRYDVKSIMSKYMTEYKQYNLAYLLFITDRDNVFTFVTGWNMQGWINGGIDALEEIEQPKEEQPKEIEQPKEEQEPAKKNTIENNDVIKDIFVVNDENIYDNINDAVNDNATDKAIDFFTLPYWTTGACVKNIDKKRWGARCNLLVSDGELVAFELTSSNNKTRRHDITMIRQLVFYARRLKAGENIKNEINREYRERSQQND